jgi:hypothetical protein
MRLRGPTTALLALGLVSGCTSGGDSAPAATTSQQAASHLFLEKAGDSDFFDAINCDAAPGDVDRNIIDQPLDGRRINFTLGDTEHDPNDLHNKSIRFLGGATIYITGGSIETDVALSDTPVVEHARPSRKGYRWIVPILGEKGEPKDFNVAIELSEVNNLYYADISCTNEVPPIASTHPQV